MNAPPCVQTQNCTYKRGLYKLVQSPFGTCGHLKEVLLIEFSRTAHLTEFTLDTALHQVLSNTPAKFEVDRMNGWHGK